MRIVIAIIAALLLSGPGFAQTQPPALPTCDAPEHRALDFWIGEWNAYRADTNALAGRSTIRAEEGGCVITEQWTSAGIAHSGRSFNIYDRVSGRWEQFWVSSTGNRTHFVGGPVENGLQLTTPVAASMQPGAQPQFSRVTLALQPDGTVAQRGESSADGENWTLTYLLIYRRRE